MTSDSRPDALSNALSGLPRERTQALPALHQIHRIYGYLDPPAMERAAAHLYIPRAEFYAVATSYTEFRFQPPAPDLVRVCRGLSCRIADGGAELSGGEEAHECMFLCAAADGAAVRAPGSAPLEYAVSDSTVSTARQVVAGGLERVRRVRSADLPQWSGWNAAAAMSPSDVVAAVEASLLRGRGGAYFPVHIKWRGAMETATREGAGRPMLVVNAEEGEPGIFKDRALMEADPQRLLEGIRIAAYALGAAEAYCYINGLADRSANAVAAGLEAAHTAGLLAAGGSDDRGLQIEIRRGAGGYVCGEESVILESIEGNRAVPRPRPPLPTESGLWGRPTVINNVETLANLPDILEYGADWFRELGLGDAPGTKLLSLSGAFAQCGLLEVPLGTTVREIIDLAQPTEELAGVAIGGPSGGFLAPEQWDTPIAPGSLDGHGAVLGAGGIIAIPANFGIAAALQVWAEYNAEESCGKCTPCREGSGRMATALTRLSDSDPQVVREAARDIEELIPIIRDASLCGLGQMAPNPVTSVRRQFPQLLPIPSDA